jgi:ribose transport system ATP-binding protein/D-xylose transport system ATP-binding protein
VLSAIYGRIEHEGRILVDGREVAMRRPANSRRAGIAMLTEDRKGDGLLFNLPVLANVTIGNLAQVSRASFVDRAAERAAGLRYIRDLGIRTASVDGDVAHLSGGNQQKVLLARVLMNAPRVLLLDEPTKGVDVETKQEIYRLVVELAEQGVAILLVSSEIPELLGLCDRCLVLAGGRIVDSFDQADGSEERVVGATTLVGGTS